MALVVLALCFSLITRSAGIRARETEAIIDEVAAHSLLATESQKQAAVSESSFPIGRLLARRFVTSWTETVLVHFGGRRPGWAKITIGERPPDGPLERLKDFINRLTPSAHSTQGPVPDVIMPKDWAEQLVKYDAHALKSETDASGFCSIDLTLPGQNLVFKREPFSEECARREFSSAHELINTTYFSSGHVQQYFDMRLIDRIVYTLVEAGDGSLEDLLAQEGGALPLNRSVLILIDMLRGLQELTASRILHDGLSAHDVLFVRDRAIISGLEQTTHQPEDPEYFASYDVGKANVKAAGLVFARMCLGSKAGAIRGPPEESPGFGELDEDIKRVLRGMLASELSARWSCAAALRAVETLAAKKGIVVPPRRPTFFVRDRSTKRAIFA